MEVAGLASFIFTFLWCILAFKNLFSIVYKKHYSG